ncbi:E3 ubiquitin-protein ligase MARCHF5-like [Drosophila tropicalis]|uniref:E3 ubiquitin-protein ligase MARCHF5-like n=1 Tax=Drosophila tropicalis TaxID=46794 RepID=UPI0035ABD317
MDDLGDQDISMDNIELPLVEGGKPQRSCWICYGSEVENEAANWVNPCKCHGSSKWVHQNCLYRWIDEKQQGNLHHSVECQQCQTTYIIVLPQMSCLAGFLEKCDHLVTCVYPYAFAILLFGSVYWSAVTYGAVTVIQIIGYDEGVELLKESSSISLILVLPVIPFSLLLARLIHWENSVLRFIRSPNIWNRCPLLKWMFNSQIIMDENADGFLDVSPGVLTAIVAEPVYAARFFCGAIFLPSFATIVGKLVFNQVPHPVVQTLLGGATYIVIKGILKIYLLQSQYLCKRGRRILNYSNEADGDARPPGT